MIYSVKPLSQLVETEVNPLTLFIAFATFFEYLLIPSNVAELILESTVAFIEESAVAPKSKTSSLFIPCRWDNFSLIIFSSCHSVFFRSNLFTAFIVTVASVGKFPLPRLKTPGSEPNAMELLIVQGCLFSHFKNGFSLFWASSTVPFALKAICALIIPVSIGGIASFPIVGITFLRLKAKNAITPIVKINLRNILHPPLENFIIPS